MAIVSNMAETLEKINMRNLLPSIKSIGMAIFGFMLALNLSAQDLPKENLQSYYPFSENMMDAGHGRNPAKVSKGAFTLDKNGKRDQAFHFDGKETSLSCGKADRTIKDQFTIASWVKTNSKNEQPIISKFSVEDDHGFQLILKNGRLQLIGKDGNNSLVRTPLSRSAVDDNKWHCVVGLVKNNQWKIYVDGKQEAAHMTKHETVSFSNDHDLTIGNFENHFFHGDLDEVMIFNKSLTISEIRKFCPIKDLTKEEMTNADDNMVIVTDLEKKKIEALESKHKILKELDRSTLKEGQTIPIKNLYFQADTSRIDASSYPVLNEVYQFLSFNNDVVIELGGHTNGIPEHDYCDKLSNERARTVAEYLIEKGVASNNITYKGYGKRYPIASNETKNGRIQNQRVEIKILRIGH